MDIEGLIRLALKAVTIVETAKGTIADIRAVITRTDPDQVARFDAAVAAARKPSQDAADRASRENASLSGITELSNDD